MDIPIALLGEFVYFRSSKEQIEARLIQLSKQFLADIKLITNETTLSKNIIEFFEQPLETKIKLKAAASTQTLYARICFVFSLLLYDKSQENKQVLDMIVTTIETKLNFYEPEMYNQILICYDVLTNKVVMYRTL